MNDIDFNTRILKTYRQYGNETSRVYYWPQIYVRRWYKLFLGYGWKDIAIAQWGYDPSYGTSCLSKANDVLADEVLAMQPKQVEVESFRELEK
jgi:hypothetical protein